MWQREKNHGAIRLIPLPAASEAPDAGGRQGPACVRTLPDVGVAVGGGVGVVITSGQRLHCRPACSAEMQKDDSGHTRGSVAVRALVIFGERQRNLPPRMHRTKDDLSGPFASIMISCIRNWQDVFMF